MTQTQDHKIIIIIIIIIIKCFSFWRQFNVKKSLQQDSVSSVRSTLLLSNIIQQWKTSVSTKLLEVKSKLFLR